MDGALQNLSAYYITPTYVSQNMAFTLTNHIVHHEILGVPTEADIITLVSGVLLDYLYLPGRGGQTLYDDFTISGELTLTGNSGNIVFADGGSIFTTNSGDFTVDAGTALIDLLSDVQCEQDLFVHGALVFNSPGIIQTLDSGNLTLDPAYGNNTIITSDMYVDGELDLIDHKIVNLGYPTDDDDAATKEYVDRAAASLKELFLSNTASADIAGYKLLSDTNDGAQNTVVVAGISAETLVEEWVTAAGEPALDYLVEGELKLQVYASVDSTSAVSRLYKLRAAVYKRAADTTETLLGQDDDGAYLTTTTSWYTPLIRLEELEDLAADDRIVVKLYAIRTSSVIRVVNRNITVYLGSATTPSRVALPVSLAVLDNYLPLAGGTITGDLAVDGTVTLNAGGTIATTSNGNLSLIPNGTGITVVGNAGATSHTLNTNDDLFVSGKLEVDGVSYFDGNITGAANITYGAANGFADSANNFKLVKNSLNTDLLFSVSCPLTIAAWANRGQNHDHAVTTNPTLFIHSALDPDTDNTRWGSFSHTGTAGAAGYFDYVTGAGPHRFGGTGTPGSATATNDVYINGKLEVDGALYADGGLGIGSASFQSTYMQLPSAYYIGWNIGSTPAIRAVQSTAQWTFLTDDAVGNAIVIGNTGAGAHDYDHAATTDPTLFIHSDTDPDSNNTQWIGFAHDKSNGIISTGLGSISLQPAAGGSVILGTSAVNSIVAGTGITAAMFAPRVKVVGDGGAVDITANPQIAAGTDGQQIIVWGTSDANTVQLDTGTGLLLAGGTSFVLGSGDNVTLIYDSTLTAWVETARSNVS